MELLNDTPYSAKLFKMSLNDLENACSLIVKVSYDVNSEDPQISKEQNFEVNFEPSNSGYGQIPSDAVYKKKGVDVMIFGFARSESAKKNHEVIVKIGQKFENRIHVYGDRQWTRKHGYLSISEPKPFKKFPVSSNFSYGGFSNFDGLKVPYQKNAFGRGYIIEEKDAEGTFLPNIEDPSNLINSWKDQPNPVGISSCDLYGLKAEKYLSFDKSKGGLVIDDKIQNQAFPDMIIDEISDSDEVQIKGVKERELFSFFVPNHKLQTTIKVGEAELKKPLNFDTLSIFPEENKICLTYRYPFKYKIKELEKRTCQLIDLGI